MVEDKSIAVALRNMLVMNCFACQLKSSLSIVCSISKVDVVLREFSPSGTQLSEE